MLIATLAVAVAAPLGAADIEAGREKAKPCTACHGKDGIGTAPHYPNLAGQKALYLEQQLRAFRDGARQSEAMTIVVRSLSDRDIENLAAFYESLPPGGASE